MVREEVKVGGFRWEDGASGYFVIVAFCDRKIADNRLRVSCSSAGPGPGVWRVECGWFVSSIEDNVMEGAHKSEHQPTSLGGVDAAS